MAGEFPVSLEQVGAYPYSAGVAGSLIMISGAKKLGRSLAMETTEQRGDNKVLASYANLGSVELEIVVGQMKLAAAAAVGGGTITTTGTGSTAVTKLNRRNTNNPPDYKLVAQTRAKDIDGGAFRVTYHQCQYQGGGDYDLNDLEFTDITFNAKAIEHATLGLYDEETMATWAALV